MCDCETEEIRGHSAGASCPEHVRPRLGSWKNGGNLARSTGEMRQITRHKVPRLCLLAIFWSSTSTIVTCRRRDQPSLFGAPPSAGERNDYVEMQLEQVYGTRGQGDSGLPTGLGPWPHCSAASESLRGNIICFSGNKKPLLVSQLRK